MIALKEFRYKDMETGGVVTVQRGETVSERVMNMHRDGGAVLIRTKFVAGNEVAAGSQTAPVVKRKRGRPKKNV